ncbi:MAG: hypothetical protein APF77_19190 [Clostridia bacterium BRH_c25]|nr:MAG: hypothetical protein APF77_19190 [Clostridia bacterium BRH_c25]
MKSQKLITLALVVVLVLSLAACGSSAPAAAEPTAAPTPEPTAAPAASEPAPAAANGFKDGSYKASQDKYDDYGWKGQIAIEVKDGKISSVDFDYVNKDNKLKSEDQGYIKAMEDASKVNLAKAMEELESTLLGNQDATAVDAISGATTTSNDFKSLAESALKDAK